VLGLALALAEPALADSDFDDPDALEGAPASAELLLFTD
jgi:hypothetical protein